MKEYIEHIAKGITKPVVVAGEVLAVHTDRFTVDFQPDSAGAPILDAKLCVIETDQHSIAVIPRIGAKGLVLIESTQMQFFFIGASEYQEARIKIGETLITIGGEIVINGGENGALPKLPVLQTEIGHNSAFLNMLRTVFNSWVPAAGDGGAALKTAMSAAIANLPVADLSNAGNEKIKH